MLTLGILISGRGSNMHALAQACAEPGFPARIGVVISNRPDAAGLARAAEAGLSTVALDHKAYESREAFDAAVEAALIAHQVDLVCLGGFMRIFSDAFAERWTGRIVNVHPSLLPLFPGLRPQRQALEAGVLISGASVHWVIPALDQGPLIGQAAVPVLPGDDEDTLSARILPTEHQLYPACIRMIAEGRARFEAGRTVFADPQAAPTLFVP